MKRILTVTITVDGDYSDKPEIDISFSAEPPWNVATPSVTGQMVNLIAEAVGLLPKQDATA